jgi:hypothetical protein
MRNNVTASSSPQHAGATPGGRGPSRRRTTVLRGLLALPLSLALIAPGATALGAEATTGYSQTTPPPTTVTTTVTTPPSTVTTTTTTPPTPTREVKPETTNSVPKKTPKHGVHPATTGGEVSTTVTTPHATTLPFTGLDLRWVIVGGMLLLGTGLSIMYVQRGRHGTGR